MVTLQKQKLWRSGLKSTLYPRPLQEREPSWAYWSRRFSTTTSLKGAPPSQLIYRRENCLFSSLGDPTWVPSSQNMGTDVGDIHWEGTRPSAGRLFNILGQFHSSQLLSKLFIALKIKLWASSGPHFLPGHAERGFAAPGRRMRALCSPTAFPQTEQRTQG